MLTHDPTIGPVVRRVATLVCTLALTVPVLAAIAPPAGAATPDLILGRNRIGEFQGVRGEHFLAWQQNTRRNPDRYDVFASPIDGGQEFKVNARGTSGANGGIDGDRLVYQQFEGESSDLMFFDLAARDRTSPRRGVNTSQWEYWPSVSGDRLLFGRLADNGNRRIVLFDLDTGTSEVLDKVRGRGSFLAPGQVNGAWATWSRCPADGSCEVIRYHIPDGAKETIPNPGREQRAASIGPDGTVYFARARGACGSGVRLISYPVGGPETEQWRLPGGDDIGTTRVYEDADGGLTVYFDQFACGQAAVSDVWEIVEGGQVRLSVERGGDGTGTVTGPGIDCGSDCAERYDPGTVVTLTATPGAESTFLEWTGACTTTTTTCTVTMDAAKSVTAKFSVRPVLNVSKAGTGQGTVTSNPSGISCGGNCSAPYDLGTQVTLTADPGSNSTFGGWSGACSGSSLTCTVTMNGPKTVTATFDAWPVLDVFFSGDGAGTVTGSGISCPGDCSEAYASGTSVTLTAAANAGSEFVGWSGDCTGTGECQVTMDGPKSVTATFDDPALPPPAVAGARLGRR